MCVCFIERGKSSEHFCHIVLTQQGGGGGEDEEEEGAERIKKEKEKERKRARGGVFILFSFPPLLSLFPPFLSIQ